MKKHKSKIKIISDIATYVIAVAAVCLMAIFLSLSISSKNGSEVPSLFGSGVLAVQSGSMEPTFKKGDLVIVKKLTTIEEKSDLKVGDIITYKFRVGDITAFNSHRITEVTTNDNGVFYRTKGDNSPSDADPVFSGDIFGVYVRHHKGLGSFVDFLRSFGGFFLFVLLPLLLFSGYRIYLVIKTIREIRLEKKKELASSATDELEDVKRELEELRAKFAESQRQTQAK